MLEQGAQIMRSRTRLRVALETEGRQVAVVHALQGTVEQGAVGGAQFRREAVLVHGEAVVLAADHDPARVQILDRVVGPVVTEFHLHRARASGQAEELVPEADPEQGHARRQQFADGVYGVVAGVRIAGAVGQEDAVGLFGQDLPGRRLRRHHGQAATQIGEDAQDIALDAVVIGNHAPGSFSLRRPPGFPGPGPFLPVIGGFGTDPVREAGALEPGKRAGRRYGLFRVRAAAGNNAAVLGALVAQQAGQAPGIDAGDGNEILCLQILRQ